MGLSHRIGRMGLVGGMILAGLLLISSVAVAASPDQVVTQRTDLIAGIMEEPVGPERTERLTQSINESIDFAHLASRALGRHWRERTEEEQEEFLTLLQRLLQANYENRLADHQLDANYEVEYTAARQRAGQAFVGAKITYKARTEPVLYRLYRRDGQWHIYDLVIDDISLEETYREGYVPIIEEDGWEELISLMRERVEELEKE